MKYSIFLNIILILTVPIYTNAQWIPVNNGLGNVTILSLAPSGNNIFAGTWQTGVYLTTNYGANWTQTSLNNRQVYSLAINGNYIFAGTYLNFGVYLSTNNGTNWAQTSLNNRYVVSLAINGNNIFAGTDLGVYLSTNNGTNWTQTSLNNRTVYSLAINGNNIFAGTNYDGVYLSTNNGTNWTQTSLNNLGVLSLAINGINIFAGTHNGIYLSTNNGSSWAQLGLIGQLIYSLAVNGNNVFSGTYQNGVYVSNNNGGNWTQRNEGLGNLIIGAFCILNNYIFAGTDRGGSIYRRPLSELTGIQPISNEIPNEFSLSQNYPNPFNPITKIKFQIPKSGFVNMIIYDILGREITTLVNEELKPGTYEVTWDGSNYPSGVYYYKLTAGVYSETKKMVLIK